MVELLGAYSNQNIGTRLCQILAGHGRDEPSDRTVQSVRRNPPKLNPDIVRAMALARTDGAEIDDLAERFGVNRNTVMGYLEQAGVPKQRWRGRTLGAEQLEAAGRLYETGVNLIEVGKRFNVDRRYLRQALPAAGFMLRKAGQQKRQC